MLGHKGVEGNEQADEEAKKAIMEGSSETNKLPRLLNKTLPHSKSTIKWMHNEKLKWHVQKQWQASKQYSRMVKTDPTTPSNKLISLIAKLLRKLASILLQLRMGHMPLAKHLFCIRKIDSPTCPACQQSMESVQHFILHCTAHQAARQTLQNSIGGRNINVMKILTSLKSLWALFKYVAETGCLNSTFGTLLELREEEEGGSE